MVLETLKITELGLKCYALDEVPRKWERAEKTNLYYTDSTKLVVCHNRRIHGHQVFKGIAERGHSSVGYFFGFKLHLVMNHHGELISFCLTKGNIDDFEFY